ncbi:hypothetical protein [Kitasatospora sp. NPDC085464]|uniref:hypothetical protein n=1 Tax=Kitasatospora sp. NPDC085464 TaxID=3364063 RepID=UPI0037CB9248
MTTTTFVGEERTFTYRINGADPITDSEGRDRTPRVVRITYQDSTVTNIALDEGWGAFLINFGVFSLSKTMLAAPGMWPAWLRTLIERHRPGVLADYTVIVNEVPNYGGDEQWAVTVRAANGDEAKRLAVELLEKERLRQADKHDGPDPDRDKPVLFAEYSAFWVLPGTPVTDSYNTYDFREQQQAAGDASADDHG